VEKPAKLSQHVDAGFQINWVPTALVTKSIVGCALEAMTLAT